MSSIDTGSGGPWPIGGAARVVRRTGSEPRLSAGAASRGDASSVERSASLDAGRLPVDATRVAEIRKAIEDGRYPIIPMRVADAIIAAGVLLRTGK